MFPGNERVLWGRGCNHSSFLMLVANIFLLIQFIKLGSWEGLSVVCETSQFLASNGPRLLYLWDQIAPKTLVFPNRIHGSLTDQIQGQKGELQVCTVMCDTVARSGEQNI